MSRLAGDLRLAIRVLRRSPWWTALAAGMLAIGIGATTALFSLVDAVVFATVDNLNMSQAFDPGILEGLVSRAEAMNGRACLRSPC